MEPIHPLVNDTPWQQEMNNAWWLKKQQLSQQEMKDLLINHDSPTEPFTQRQIDAFFKINVVEELTLDDAMKLAATTRELDLHIDNIYDYTKNSAIPWTIDFRPKSYQYYLRGSHNAPIGLISPTMTIMTSDGGQQNIMNIPVCVRFVRITQVNATSNAHQWEYEWEEVEKTTTAGYSGWVAKATISASDDPIWATTGVAYNTLEVMNPNGAGLMGAGFDTSAADWPAGMDIVSIPVGAIVQITRVVGNAAASNFASQIVEYWFTVPNSADGPCEDEE